MLAKVVLGTQWPCNGCPEDLVLGVVVLGTLCAYRGCPWNAVCLSLLPRGQH